MCFTALIHDLEKKIVLLHALLLNLTSDFCSADTQHLPCSWMPEYLGDNVLPQASLLEVMVSLAPSAPGSPV